ncbi:hypothetical protein ACWJJH_07850 [Endozoicomonadaceae bacterium StTr2]
MSYETELPQSFQVREFNMKLFFLIFYLCLFFLDSAESAYLYPLARVFVDHEVEKTRHISGVVKIRKRDTSGQARVLFFHSREPECDLDLLLERPKENAYSCCVVTLYEYERNYYLIFTDLKLPEHTPGKADFVQERPKYAKSIMARLDSLDQYDLVRNCVLDDSDSPDFRTFLIEFEFCNEQVAIAFDEQRPSVVELSVSKEQPVDQNFFIFVYGYVPRVRQWRPRDKLFSFITRTLEATQIKIVGCDHQNGDVGSELHTYSSPLNIPQRISSASQYSQSSSIPSSISSRTDSGLGFSCSELASESLESCTSDIRFKSAVKAKVSQVSDDDERECLDCRARLRGFFPAIFRRYLADHPEKLKGESYQEMWGRMIHALLSPGTLIRKPPLNVRKWVHFHLFSSPENYIHMDALMALGQTVGQFDCLRFRAEEKNFPVVLKMAIKLRERLDRSVDAYSGRFDRLKHPDLGYRFERRIKMFNERGLESLDAVCEEFIVDGQDTCSYRSHLGGLVGYIYSLYPWIFLDGFLELMKLDEVISPAELLDDYHLYPHPRESQVWLSYSDLKNRAAYVILYALGSHFVCTEPPETDWLVSTMLVLMEPEHPAFSRAEIAKITWKKSVLQMIIDQAQRVYDEMMWLVDEPSDRPALSAPGFKTTVSNIRFYANKVMSLYSEYKQYYTSSGRELMTLKERERLEQLLNFYVGWKSGKTLELGYPKNMKRDEWRQVCKDMQELQTKACKMMPYCLMHRIPANIPAL